MDKRGELSPGRDFSIALAITLLAGVAIFSAPGPAFPTLHTILNTGIAIVTAVVSLLFWDVGVRSGSILVRYMAIVFAVAGVLEVMHVIAALEPSSGSQWLNNIHQRLRSGTWAPPSYLLPLGVGFILWTAAGLGGTALWSAGLIHAAIGAPFVYALARPRG